MSENTYTEISGKLPKVFEKIQGAGLPTTVDSKWLASIGFKSQADSTILKVLKSIDFVDNNNKITERWKNYRDRSNARKVLGKAIKVGYSELFETYPDANKRSPTELKSFFSTHVKLSDATINKVVATFNALVTISDFDDSEEPTNQTISTSLNQNSYSHELISKSTNQENQKPEGLYTLNINIQLTLPITTDQNVYDELFKSLKKNLFP